MKPDTLYRGDRRGNVTKPELYRTEGLWTKLINGGNPAYITEVGLLEAIRIHISPQTPQERAIQSTSSFLSFSSSRERALFFASDGNSDDLAPCGEYSERRYLFTMDISRGQPTNQAGVYVLSYNCNYDLVQPNTLAIHDITASHFVRCEFCKTGPQKHHLLVLDVVTFLNAYPHMAKSKNALESAQSDSEWLAMPIDFIDKLRSDSSRIPRSSSWTAEHLLLRSEQPWDGTLGEIQGLTV